jgi:putative endonuclease
MSVGQIAEHYQLTFAAVAKHLQVLERAGLVTKQRKGKEQIITLAPKTFAKAYNYLENYKQLWEDRLDRLNTFLTKEQQSLESMMFYTYVLLSKKDGQHYIGHAENLQKRLEEHNAGKNTSTKYRRPFELVYYEACKNKYAAIKREKYFKTGFGRRYLKDRLINKTINN